MTRFSVIVFVLVSYCSHAQPDTSHIPDSLFAASRWKEAIAAYETLAKSSPLTDMSWNRLGFSYHRLRDYDNAMRCYRKSLSQGSDSLIRRTVYSRIAKVHSVRKESDEAFQNLQSALSFGYMLAGELQNDADFGNIRNDPRFAEIVRLATDNAMPCLNMARARQFDFWIGNWDVFPNGSKTMAGESVIEVASGGCMILENWTSRGLTPFSGKSMNYINPETQKWEQLWIGSDGVNRNNPQKFVDGEFDNGAMRFEFEQWTSEGKKQDGRMIFFNEGPDRVRQLNEVSDDGGKSWTTVYDFIYMRKE